MGIGFMVSGTCHFVISDFFVHIMPPYLPWPLFLVYLSGAIEIGLGILLLIPRHTRFAAWGLIALTIAVFPANIHMALHTDLFPEFSPTSLWLRLPLQAVVIAWAYWYAREPK
jgi:uncharacterized membrane protein